MSNFSQYLNNSQNATFTENGANALSSTGNALLDLFGVVGSLRTRLGDVVDLFEQAFNEDALLATKLSFYARNVRGGLGEREVSRMMWKWLAIEHPQVMAKNAGLIPEFGRWDDLYAFVGTECADVAWGLIASQLTEDIGNMMKGEPVSLLAKWLKSVNTSSVTSRNLGKLTAKMLGMSQQDYRKTLSALRDYIKVTEVKISANKWDEINYEGVPSKAMANLRKAFGRHDGERFGEFIESVQKGEAKIHSGTLFPYDIFEKMGLREEYGWSNNGHSFVFDSWDAVLEEQWKALPNYVKDGENILIVADTSGSMSGRPICTSIGLAVYFAERNTGQFHNQFITFSSEPSFVTLKGKTLKEKIKSVPAIVSNTDLEAVFNLVLNTAVRNSVLASDMPKAIVVISDMEIDSASNSRSQSFNSAMKRKFEQNGYELPNMVYWNVDSRQNIFHADKNEQGVQLASGQSPSVFQSIVGNMNLTPYDAMIKVLNDEIYSAITI